MFVKDRMTTDPITVTENTPVNEAGELMRKHKFARLPVMREGKLVGIITREDLLRVSPSAATTLSVWELNYVLAKLTVKDAMTRNPFTINSGATLEEAAMLMRSKDVGALPVVEGEKLVGIITESDIFDAFLDLMGLKHIGSRLAINVEDRIGAIADLTEIIKQKGISIISMALFHRDHAFGELVLRLDSSDIKELLQEIGARGYKVTHVATWN